jgi:hypothetical protein
MKNSNHRLPALSKKWRPRMEWMPFFVADAYSLAKIFDFPLRALIRGFGEHYSACSVISGGVQRSRRTPCSYSSRVTLAR